jgi:hypothetical protein
MLGVHAQMFKKCLIKLANEVSQRFDGTNNHLSKRKASGFSHPGELNL